MRPDDHQPGSDERIDAGMDLPFDADLEVLDRDLAEAGQQARRMLYGRSQPTRVFSNQLRSWLLNPSAVPPAEGTPS